MTRGLTGAATALVAAALAAAACDTTAPERLGDPTTLRKVAGDNQTAPAGQPLASPLVVAATGKVSGEPRVDRVVEWSILTAGGALPAARTRTDSLGFAAITLTLPDEPGARTRVRASPEGSQETVVFTATSESLVAARVAAVAGVDQRAMQGDTLPEELEVVVTDGQGAAVPGATVNWRITTDNGGSLARRVTTTDSGGASTNRWRVGEVANVTDRAVAWIEGAEIDTAAFTARVTGPPDEIRVDQGAIEQDDNATTAPDSVVGDTVTVAPGFWSRKPFQATLVDAAGEAVPGVELSWTVTSGGGAVGDEAEGPGQETVTVNTAQDGSISVWRRASPDTLVAAPGEWIGATLSAEDFPEVEAVTLDALVRP